MDDTESGVVVSCHICLRVWESKRPNETCKNPQHDAHLEHVDSRRTPTQATSTHRTFPIDNGADKRQNRRSHRQPNKPTIRVVCVRWDSDQWREGERTEECLVFRRGEQDGCEDIEGLGF